MRMNSGESQWRGWTASCAYCTVNGLCRTIEPIAISAMTTFERSPDQRSSQCRVTSSTNRPTANSAAKKAMPVPSSTTALTPTSRLAAAIASAVSNASPEASTKRWGPTITDITIHGAKSKNGLDSRPRARSAIAGEARDELGALARHARARHDEIEAGLASARTGLDVDVRVERERLDLIEQSVLGE